VSPALSVLIVNWNSRDDLLGCIRSILDSEPSVSFELIVVDNGSSDGSVPAVRSLFPAVTVISNATNQGLAKANNQAMAAASGEILVLSNADVVFGTETLDEIASFFRRRPKAGLLALLLRWPDGVIQTSAGDLPSLREALLGRQAQRWSSDGRPSGFCWDRWPHDEEVRTGRAGDACFAARREAVAVVGSQDERFPLDWEAIDWSRRMKEAGWEIWFSPHTAVVHIGGASTSRMPSFRWVWQTHKGMYRYFAKQSSVVARPILALLFSTRAVVKWSLMAAGLPMWRLAHRGRD
jgi:GT2 family glycosyltransferase